MKPHEGSAEQYARTIEAVYQSLAQLYKLAERIEAALETNDTAAADLRRALEGKQE